MATKFQCELVSWGKIVSLTRKLALLIKEDGYCPGVIIAIGRGGYVPARLLADYFDIMNLTSIKVEHYKAGAHRQEVARIKYPLSVDVSGQHVLVVDDVSDTGDTFEVAIQNILEHSEPAGIKTAVLHHKAVSSFVPDYYACMVIKWRWIIYPWAVVEDISSFIDEMAPRPASLEGISEQLTQGYGIRVPRKLLEYVTDMQEAK